MSAMAFKWDGETMRPIRAKLADETFVVGQVHWLEEEKLRSVPSERHQFAWLREAWKNLPEGFADLYPSPEHLRKRALIDAGFYHEEIIDAGSAAAALRIAPFFRKLDDFALTVVRGPLIVRRTAKSQRRHFMDAKEFQDSKTKILEIVAGLIGVTPDQLQSEAGRAA